MLFLPSIISLLMNRVMVLLPYRASGGTSRLTTRARRGMAYPPRQLTPTERDYGTEERCEPRHNTREPRGVVRASMTAVLLRSGRRRSPAHEESQDSRPGPDSLPAGALYRPAPGPLA